MNRYLAALSLVTVLALAPQGALAEVTVEDVSLSEDVQNREPVGKTSPAAACENGGNGHHVVPVIDTSMTTRVYFWNRLKTDGAGTLRHTWYMNRDQDWREAAEIDLGYSPSPGYRTWSSKQLDPSMHTGEWKVEVTITEEPGRVLCSARFKVQ